MAQRWDRDRFERMRGANERDYYKFEERDMGGPRGRHEVLLAERTESRGPHGRFEERERFIEEDRLPARGPAPRFLDDPVPPEVARQALAPYRRPRPQFVRRQSSLDTFDRKQMPRYGDEYRMPPEMPIPLPIRRAPSPRRGHYYEEYEERFHGSDDDYRDVRVKEERKGDHRSRSRMRSRSVHKRRSYSSSSESGSEKVNKSSIVGRKGRTKLPKRLAHKSAIIELGYPYVEEENFIIVQRALDKTHIDTIVEMSKKYKESKDKIVTYKYDGVNNGPAPTPKKEEKKEEKKVQVEKGEVKKEDIKKETIKSDGTKVEEHIEKKETKPIAPPAAAHPPPAANVDAFVKKTTTTTTRTIDPPDHHHHHQDLAVVVPRRMTEDDLQREIQALEMERRALRYERDEYDVVDHREKRKDIYRVERDRKGRSRSRPPNPKAVGMAMAILS